jgi:hypothetical protein
MALLEGMDESKKKNQMNRAIKKDRNDLFTDEQKASWKTETSKIIEESKTCETVDATLDVLESGFQRSRAVYGKVFSVPAFFFFFLSFSQVKRPRALWRFERRLRMYTLTMVIGTERLQN